MPEEEQIPSPPKTPQARRRQRDGGRVTDYAEVGAQHPRWVFWVQELDLAVDRL